VSAFDVLMSMLDDGRCCRSALAGGGDGGTARGRISADEIEYSERETLACNVLALGKGAVRLKKTRRQISACATRVRRAHISGFGDLHQRGGGPTV